VNQKEKLILASMQIENLIHLLRDNEYEKYLYRSLYSIKYEVERQLTNTQTSSKIKEQTTN